MVTLICEKEKKKKKKKSLIEKISLNLFRRMSEIV